MATLRTRASKGSELTHNELDANFDRTVSPKTTTYSCLVGDNRSVIEGNHATVAFTITLGDAATMAAAETGDYEVTIANIGAALVTVAKAGSDTIDGAATSIALPQYSSVTLKVNNATDGYNSIGKVGIVKQKIVDIGDWNMDTDSFVDVAHGLTYANIRSVSALIRNDTDSFHFDINSVAGVTTGSARVDSTDVTLIRTTSAGFDHSDFDATSYNRGWITIHYV